MAGYIIISIFFAILRSLNSRWIKFKKSKTEDFKHEKIFMILDKLFLVLCILSLLAFPISFIAVCIIVFFFQ